MTGTLHILHSAIGNYRVLLPDRLPILYVVEDLSCSISCFDCREVQLRKCLVLCLKWRNGPERLHAIVLAAVGGP